MSADAAEMEMTPLSVVRMEPVAQDIQLFELRRPDRADLPEFTPGAHVCVRAPNGFVRKYSLCNDPAERDRYLIAVKRETAGRGGSASMADDGSSPVWRTKRLRNPSNTRNASAVRP